LQAGVRIQYTKIAFDLFQYVAARHMAESQTRYMAESQNEFAQSLKLSQHGFGKRTGSQPALELGPTQGFQT
jgi:hypothetical protein